LGPGFLEKGCLEVERWKSLLQKADGGSGLIVLDKSPVLSDFEMIRWCDCTGAMGGFKGL